MVNTGAAAWVGTHHVSWSEPAESEGAHNPFPSLGGTDPSSGLTGLTTGLSSSAVFLPLGLLAIYHAVKQSKARREEAKQLKTELREINDTPINHSQPFETFLSAKKSTLKQSLDHATLGQRICSNQTKLGLVACFTSLGGLATKIPIFATTAIHGAQAVSHSLTLAATALGAIGTFALGPLLTIYSARVGMRRSTQVANKRKQIRTQFTLAQNQLNTLISGPTSNSREFSAYKNFIQRQGNKRTDFFRGFKQWNKAFGVATGFYGLAVSAQIVVSIVASCVGSAVAANPIGLGVLLSLTTLAGLGMCISSFVLSRRENKYFSHTAQQGQLFNRDLVVLDQIAKKGTNTQFDLASSCLKRLDTRKEAIRTFLGEAAKQTGKVSPLGLVDQRRKINETQATIWKRLQGQVLDSKNLSHYLQTDQGKQQLHQLFKTDLDAEVHLLNEQIKTHNTLCAHNPLGKHTETLKDQQRSIQNLKNALERDDIDSTQISNYFGIPTHESGHNNARTLATYLLKKADRTLRNERGVLFETQLQAAKASS